MLKGHLSPLLTTNFSKHVQSFDLDCIVTSCNDFIKQLSLVFEEGIDESPVYKASLNMLRLLGEFNGLLKFYVFHSIMLHRTCCKLLFVLYELFTNLLKEVCVCATNLVNNFCKKNLKLYGNIDYSFHRLI